MKRTDTPLRLMAFALSAVIATGLIATLVGSMPPDFDGSPNDARNRRHATVPTEVAIVPSRIEVVGVRGEVTAASEQRSAGPRS